MIDDYPMVVFWSAEDDEYVASLPDLPGCSASGATREDAVREGQIAGELGLEVAQASGWSLPEPTRGPAVAKATA